MQKRPIVKIKNQTADTIIDTISWTLLLVLWVFVIVTYTSLPDRIPIHFNFYGEPDAWAQRISIFLHPVLATMLMFLITAISRFPHTFNYPVDITVLNAERNYRAAVRVMKIIRFVVLLLFLYAGYSTAMVAHERWLKLPGTPLVILLAVIGMTIISFVIISKRSKK